MDGIGTWSIRMRSNKLVYDHGGMYICELWVSYGIPVSVHRMQRRRLRIPRRSNHWVNSNRAHKLFLKSGVWNTLTYQTMKTEEKKTKITQNIASIKLLTVHLLLCKEADFDSNLTLLRHCSSRHSHTSHINQRITKITIYRIFI